MASIKPDFEGYTDRRFNDMTVAEIVAVLVADERAIGVPVEIGHIDDGPKVSIDFQYQTIADALTSIADIFGYTLTVKVETHRYQPREWFVISLRK